MVNYVGIHIHPAYSLSSVFNKNAFWLKRSTYWSFHEVFEEDLTGGAVQRQGLAAAAHWVAVAAAVWNVKVQNVEHAQKCSI